MQVFDNVFPAKQFEKLQKEVMGYGIPWHYGRKVAYDTSPVTNPYLYGWGHTALDTTGSKSELFPLIKTAFTSALDRFEIPINRLIRIRLIMNTITPESYIDKAHVDMNFAHQTALIYINDSDGPTSIYNETFDTAFNNGGFDEHYNFIKNKLTVAQTIEPVANRMVIFNGLQYHCGTTPSKTDRRIIINVNYV